MHLISWTLQSGSKQGWFTGEAKRWIIGARKDGLEELIGWMDERDGLELWFGGMIGGLDWRDGLEGWIGGMDWRVEGMDWRVEGMDWRNRPEG
jgi:hypothetical protein